MEIGGITLVTNFGVLIHSWAKSHKARLVSDSKVSHSRHPVSMHFQQVIDSMCIQMMTFAQIFLKLIGNLASGRMDRNTAFMNQCSGI